MIYVLDFRLQKVGGPVAPGVLALGPGGTTGSGPSPEDWLRLETRLIFLVHGFNVNREEGRRGLLDLAHRLAEPQGVGVVAVLWPGDSSIGPLSYSFEGRDADDTAAELLRFIDRAVPEGVPLSFVAHSLGSRVVMETIERLKNSRFPTGEVCLMAAAVDDDCLASTVYSAAMVKPRRVAVLSSKKDRVLQLAYPAGDLLQAFLFTKDIAGLALGYIGPKPARRSGAPVPPNVLHEPIPKSRDAGHGDYIPGTTPTPEQLSAVRFAGDVLAGVSQPTYT